MLFGIAIRTGSPLSLNIAEPVWKQVAGMPLSVSDLAEIDKDCVPGTVLTSISWHLRVHLWPQVFNDNLPKVLPVPFHTINYV